MMALVMHTVNGNPARPPAVPAVVARPQRSPGSVGDRCRPLDVLHPLFVHLHIALLAMGFLAMYAWLFRGLASSVFEDRIYRFARQNTFWGWIAVLLSMAAGVHDGLRGQVIHFDGPHGGWLALKAGLSVLIVVVYGAFLVLSGRKKRFLQEDRGLMAWCLLTQAVGMLLVAAVTTIGTMIVYYRNLLPPMAAPW